MTLELDDGSVSACNTSTGNDGGTQIPSLLFTFDDLSATEPHTLTIGWSASNANGDNSSYSYAYFDRLKISNFREAQSPASSQAAPSTPGAAASQGINSKHLDRGVIAGIVVALLVFVGLFLAASYWFLRRRRYFGWPKYRPKRNITVITTPSKRPGSEEPPSPANSSQDARPHLSLPPAYLADWKNDQLKFGDAIYEKTVTVTTIEPGNSLGGVGYTDLEGGYGFGDRADNDSFTSQIANLSCSTHDSPPSPTSPTTPQAVHVRKENANFLPDTLQPPVAPTNPDTRLSYFSVRIAKRTKASREGVRIINANALGHTSPSSPSRELPPLPTLPPLPPLPAQTIALPQREMIWLTKKSLHRPPRSSRKEPTPDDTSSTRPSADTSYKTSTDYLSVDAGPSSYASRISLRSLPPPYALHP